MKTLLIKAEAYLIANLINDQYASIMIVASIFSIGIGGGGGGGEGAMHNFVVWLLRKEKKHFN